MGAVRGSLKASRREEGTGHLKRLAYRLGVALEWIDGQIDRIPWWRQYDGERRWVASCWGCYPLRMSRVWQPLVEYGERRKP